MTDDEYFAWLKEANGYKCPVALGNGLCAYIDVRPYNTQIIVSKIGDMYGNITAW